MTPPAPGESADDLLLEMRARLLVEQRRLLRDQRRSFQRIQKHVEQEMKDLMRTDAAWSDAMPDYRHKRAILEAAIAQTDATLVKNGQALGASVHDPFSMIAHHPQDLLDTPRAAGHRRIDREYRRGLRIAATNVA
jgi:hypothetical protein